MSLNQDILAVVAKARESAPPEAFRTLGGMLARLEGDGVGSGAPKAGERAPEVVFLTTEGTLVPLVSLHAERPLVLLFYRGRWCPFCDLTLRAYDKAAPAFATAGASLAAVSPQTRDETVATGRECGLAFPLFSDPGNAAARRFGLTWQVRDGAERALYEGFGARVPEANGDDTWELPAPAVFVINRNGIICWAWTDSNWTKRAEPEEVLAAVRASGVARGSRAPAGLPR